MSGLTVIASRKARPVALKRLSDLWWLFFSVENLEVEIHLNIESQGLEKFFYQFCVKITQFWIIKTSIKDQETTSRQV